VGGGRRCNHHYYFLSVGMADLGRGRQTWGKRRSLDEAHSAWIFVAAGPAGLRYDPSARAAVISVFGTQRACPPLPPMGIARNDIGETCSAAAFDSKIPQERAQAGRQLLDVCIAAHDGMHLGSPD
jgi:hypothetical protein